MLKCSSGSFSAGNYHPSVVGVSISQTKKKTSLELFARPQGIQQKLSHGHDRLIDHRKSHQSSTRESRKKKEKMKNLHTLHPSYKTLKKIVEIISL